MYIISCVRVDKRSDDGSQLQPKHVAVNKLIRFMLHVTFNTHTCDLFNARYTIYSNFAYSLNSRETWTVILKESVPKESH